MTILKAEKRDEKMKANQLRKIGKITGSVSGKSLGGSLSVQFAVKDVEQFLRTNAVGSKVELQIGSETLSVLLKEINRSVVEHHIENIVFQALSADEKITETAQIILINRNTVSMPINQPLFELKYKSFPADTIKNIEIDLTGKKPGTHILVSDLEISKNPAIEILTPADTLVFSIATHQHVIAEEPAQKTAEPAPAPKAEVAKQTPGKTNNPVK
jgi:large subunit ribosomal protein L25